uniref:CARD domain-containing protein n=1 Tax=Echinostoma caproni TaxID=27848 RepID=A0A183ANR5_9TREM
LDEEVAVPRTETGVSVSGKTKTESSFPVLSSSIPSHSISPGPLTDMASQPTTPGTGVSPSATANGTNSTMTARARVTELTGVPSGLHGHVLGRNFDDDSDDDDIRIGEELVQQSALFERACVVLESPARCGVFLNYLFTQNRDVSPAVKFDSVN